MADVGTLPEAADAAATAPGAAPAGAPTVDTRLPSMWTALTPTRAVTSTAVLAFALFGLPALLNAYWMQILMTMVFYSAVTVGLNVLVGRVGMYSLCQIPLVAAGVWFALRVKQEVDLPFPVLLLVTGLLTSLVGVVIGLPALRLKGLYLALITLMGAGAITLMLSVVKLPNGGGGFWGFDRSIASGVIRLGRPSVATTDVAYYRYTLIVVAILFVLFAWHLRGKPGRAWAAIRQSQVTAVAAGVNTTLYKLWAFALSAFAAGIGGAMIAAGPGGVSVSQFPVEGSILLLAVVLMGGVYSIWGAVVAAFFLRVFPRLLDQKLGLPSEILTMLFGVGIMQVLMANPAGIVSDLEKLLRKLGGLGTKLIGRGAR
ncbi:MAG TPA: branched-chain amino acid ABC transporter permease [Ilumatobacter sp.]|nr:branched-chain amino acid ABC transporter permease [Ilumatobacter sp.]